MVATEVWSAGAGNPLAGARAATAGWRTGPVRRVSLLLVRTWLPIVLLLIGYNISRGFAATSDPHVFGLIAADRWLFGWLTGGQVPTVWLQHRWYDPAQIFWYDLAASAIYFSHFVLTAGIAVTLWLRNRQRWLAFMRRFLFLCAVGLATYFLYPAAPPWWAHEHGHLPEVARVSTRGWSEVGLTGAATMINSGQSGIANPVAAMPSLHTAWALMAVMFFLPGVRYRWWPLLLAYPVAMGLTLIYTGEHYAIDVLVGAGYAVVAILVMGMAERWWRARRQRRGGGEPGGGEPGGGEPGGGEPGGPNHPRESG